MLIKILDLNKENLVGIRFQLIQTDRSCKKYINLRTECFSTVFRSHQDTDRTSGKNHGVYNLLSLYSWDELSCNQLQTLHVYNGPHYQIIKSKNRVIGHRFIEHLMYRGVKITKNLQFGFISSIHANLVIRCSMKNLRVDTDALHENTRQGGLSLHECWVKR